MSLRQDFTRYLEVRNDAPATVGAYLRHVEGLAWHYHRPPNRINHHEIQHYLLYLAKTRHYAWNTIHGIVFGLRAFFFGFLRRPETDFIIPIPKLPKRLPLVWTPEVQESKLSKRYLAPFSDVFSRTGPALALPPRSLNRTPPLVNAVLIGNLPRAGQIAWVIAGHFARDSTPSIGRPLHRHEVTRAHKIGFSAASVFHVWEPSANVFPGRRVHSTWRTVKYRISFSPESKAIQRFFPGMTNENLAKPLW